MFIYLNDYNDLIKMNNKNSVSNTTSSLQYNPWDDKKIFVQNVGDISSFISYLDENNITTLGSTTTSKENNEEDDMLVMLKELDYLSKIHFEKINLLEELYEKYRNESILSKDKNYILIDSIAYLTEMMKKFESNKIKIANLLHNTQLSENNIVRIKHSKKLEFIKMLKIILSPIYKNNNSGNNILYQNQSNSHSQRNELELINLSLNMHEETINKLVFTNN